MGFLSLISTPTVFPLYLKKQSILSNSPFVKLISVTPLVVKNCCNFFLPIFSLI
nr:MAG TPA: hypothetical protein [Caudoviricetes sp.]